MTVVQNDICLEGNARLRQNVHKQKYENKKTYTANGGDPSGGGGECIGAGGQEGCEKR